MSNHLTYLRLEFSARIKVSPTNNAWKKKTKNIEYNISLLNDYKYIFMPGINNYKTKLGDKNFS